MLEMYVTLYFVDDQRDFSLTIPAYLEEEYEQIYLRKGAYCVDKIYFEKLIDSSVYRL